MPDSKPYTVKKLGNKKIFSIILVDPRDVHVATESGKKGHKLEHAFHTCGNPQKPKTLELLSLAGLVDVDVDLRGPAVFVPRMAKAGAFVYSPSSDGLGGRGNGDWEASDSGGLLKRRKARRGQKRARPTPKRG